MENSHTDRVTGSQLREAMVRQNIVTVRHHTCSICNEAIHYIRKDDHLFFDSSCGCCQSEPRLWSWDEAANWVNAQTNEDYRDVLLERFGLKPHDK